MFKYIVIWIISLLVIITGYKLFDFNYSNGNEISTLIFFNPFMILTLALPLIFLAWLIEKIRSS